MDVHSHETLLPRSGERAPFRQGPRRVARGVRFFTAAGRPDVARPSGREAGYGGQARAVRPGTRIRSWFMFHSCALMNDLPRRCFRW